MITLTAEYQAAVESDAFSPCYLIKLPGPLTLTTAPDDLSFGGDIYVSGGLTVALDGIASTTDLSTNTYTITLDNANQTAMAIYANGNYVGAPSTVYLGLLDDSGSLILDGSGFGPIEMYTGVFDGWAVKEDKNRSTIAIKLRSHWAAFNRKAGRFTNSSSQQELYPTDSFFDFAHVDQNEIRWGV